MDNRTIEQVRANEDRLIDKNILLEQENQQLRNDNAVMKANLIQVSDKQRDLYKSIIDEVREKLKGHKQDLDYEPWHLYKIKGIILFDIVEILDKAYIESR